MCVCKWMYVHNKGATISSSYTRLYTTVHGDTAYTAYTAPHTPTLHTRCVYSHMYTYTRPNWQYTGLHKSTLINTPLHTSTHVYTRREHRGLTQGPNARAHLREVHTPSQHPHARVHRDPRLRRLTLFPLWGQETRGREATGQLGR